MSTERVFCGIPIRTVPSSAGDATIYVAIDPGRPGMDGTGIITSRRGDDGELEVMNYGYVPTYRTISHDLELDADAAFDLPEEMRLAIARAMERSSEEAVRAAFSGGPWFGENRRPDPEPRPHLDQEGLTPREFAQSLLRVAERGAPARDDDITGEGRIQRAAIHELERARASFEGARREEAPTVRPIVPDLVDEPDEILELDAVVYLEDLDEDDIDQAGDVGLADHQGRQGLTRSERSTYMERMDALVVDLPGQEVIVDDPEAPWRVAERGVREWNPQLDVANGQGLDRLGGLYGVRRRDLEPDSGYRARLQAAHEEQTIVFAGATTEGSLSVNVAGQELPIVFNEAPDRGFSMGYNVVPEGSFSGEDDLTRHRQRLDEGIDRACRPGQCVTCDPRYSCELNAQIRYWGRTLQLIRSLGELDEAFEARLLEKLRETRPQVEALPSVCAGIDGIREFELPVLEGEALARAVGRHFGIRWGRGFWRVLQGLAFVPRAPLNAVRDIEVALEAHRALFGRMGDRRGLSDGSGSLSIREASLVIHLEELERARVHLRENCGHREGVAQWMRDYPDEHLEQRRHVHVGAAEVCEACVIQLVEEGEVNAWAAELAERFEVPGSRDENPCCECGAPAGTPHRVGGPH